LPIGVMLKFLKYVSAVMITVFAMLIVAEIAGVSVCHAASVELFHVFPGASHEPKEGKSNSKVPCRNDETPIEHVIHNSASSVPSKSRLFSYSIPAILASAGLSVFSPPVIETPLVIGNQALSSFLSAYTHPNRPPPVSL